MIGLRKDSYEVIIVGGGISGLSAAKRLKDLGVKDVLVLEREQECGGAPRHILNPSFGLFEFRRPMLGPEYARRMRERVRGVELATGFNVTRLLPKGLYTSSQTGYSVHRNTRVEPSRSSGLRSQALRRYDLR